MLLPAGVMDEMKLIQSALHVSGDVFAHHQEHLTVTKLNSRHLIVKTQLYYINLYIQRMVVTANQLHVSASNSPSSGCTSNEKGWELYNIKCNLV